MAKIVWKKTPKSAYEWIELEGGDNMRDHERASMLDDFISENGLVPVETTFMGEVPTHKYGRYIAGGAAQALAPPALPSRQDDLIKANDEIENLKAQLARANAQLDKKPEKSKAEVVEGDATADIGTSGGGAQSTEDARETLNQQDGFNITSSSEEVREDMSTADRSDDNPVVKRGRPKKDAE